ncbi:MAG: VirB3 family type IV secretion system protein [Pseudomonadota bacterium]|nr:VirB3 family type IV secretion system protein [Pseudomonadota bacterium]
MQKNTLFRGCTRPPMFMGVPYIPFFLGAGGCVLMAAWFNLFWLLAIPPVLMVMRAMTRHDEMIFRLLGIRLQFLVRVRNRNLHDKMWIFTPNLYREKQPRKA